MAKAHGILQISRLSGLDTATLINIQNMVARESVQPAAIILTGVSDQIMKYSLCGCFVTELLDLLGLKRKALIVLPDARDNSNMYGPEFHERLDIGPFRPEYLQFINMPGLQLVGVGGQAADELNFHRWCQDLPPNDKGARILVTTFPVSHWHAVPRKGFNDWRIEGPLFEVTTAGTKAPQPFVRQIATPPGTCQYLVYDVEAEELKVGFKLIFDEKARPIRL